MSGYTKLFNSILASTVWGYDSDTRIVWVTMLAMADQHGVVSASVPGLAKFAGVSRDATERALALFLAPDPDSRTEDYEGRRIEKVDGGWLLLSHAKYRNLQTSEYVREKTRIRVANHRARKSASEASDVTPVTPCNAPSNVTVTPSRSRSDQNKEGERAGARPPTPGPEPEPEPESPEPKRPVWDFELPQVYQSSLLAAGYSVSLPRKAVEELSTIARDRWPENTAPERRKALEKAVLRWAEVADEFDRNKTGWSISSFRNWLNSQPIAAKVRSTAPPKQPAPEPITDLAAHIAGAEAALRAVQES